MREQRHIEICLLTRLRCGISSVLSSSLCLFVRACAFAMMCEYRTQPSTRQLKNRIIFTVKN